MTGGPYHLILLSVLCTGGYLLTYLFVGTGLISRSLHRQIWNTILLFSFLIAGILGIMLVIQLNYKLEWPFMKPFMVWHVDAGIVLCLVACFHFLRHRNYFLNMLSNKENNHSKNRDAPEKGILPERPSVLALALGFAATVIQVLMIRELTTVFQGNELMMSWTLGIWMLLTGAGTWIGRSAGWNKIGGLLQLIVWIPFFSVILMDMGRNFLFPAGELVNPFWFMAIVLLLLAPVCILTGYAFALLVRMAGKEEKSFVRIYALESLGSVAGGIIVSFLLIRWFSIMQSFLITGLVIHLSLLFIRRNKVFCTSALFQLLLFILFLSFPLDLKIKSFLFPYQNLMISRETAYGNVSVSENSGEYTFYENGAPLFTTGDVVVNEEYIHYALMQHPDPVQILLISGGVAGMTEEILKYPSVRKVTLVELNPEIIRLSAPFKVLPDDKRLEIYEGDGRRFIRHTGNVYDVAVVAVPEPSSLQINRYYTMEFISVLKSKMTPEGIVLFGLSPSVNYLSPEKSAIESMLYATLKAHFRNMAIIPGERDFFLASDGPLTADPSIFTKGKQISTVYVNSGYLDPSSTVERSMAIKERLDPDSPLNTDRRPLPVFYHSLHFLSLFFGRNYLLIILPVLLLLLPLFLMRPVSGSMYITGLSASSAEILLIFWFQTFFGNVYSAIGIIFAIFMAGLSVGSWAGTRLKTGKKHHLFAQALLAVYLLLLPVMWLTGSGTMSGPGAWLVFIPVLLIPALLTGYLYVSSSVLYLPGKESAPSSVYAADLWGSALGVILITFILLPVFGVQKSCLILAGLNVLSILIVALGKK